MTEAKFAELESQLRAVTDSVGRLLDQVAQKGFIPAFRCNHSGLLLPGNYVKDWGRDGIGIGLGPHPVSEVLDTDYDTPPAEIGRDTHSIEQVMHPVGACMSQVDLVMVSPEEYEARAAVQDRHDPLYRRRSGIVRQRQMVNPRSQLPLILTHYARARKVGL
jgi:hypothetical protein